MIVGIKVSGFEEKEVRLSPKEERAGLLSVSNHMFNKMVEEEREKVLMWLMGKFKGLRYEDLEEVYDDGCLVLWKKMKDREFRLKEKSIEGYLVKICWNIGMHYLRKVNEDVVSLDSLMERGFGMSEDDEVGIEEMFDVIEERGNKEEMFERLDKVWGKLKDVDRMILESYYVDGCKMEEIAKRIGYKNGNSVKSKKKKVLMRIKEMRDEADFKDLPAVA